MAYIVQKNELKCGHNHTSYGDAARCLTGLLDFNPRTRSVEKVWAFAWIIDTMTGDLAVPD